MDKSNNFHLLKFKNIPPTIKLKDSIFQIQSIQIWTNYRQATTGQLSVISVFMQFGGCAARVFTSVQETNGDWLIIGPFLVATLLNGIIFAQITLKNI